MTAVHRRALPIDLLGEPWPEFDTARTARRIYAIGDIHGYDTLLAELRQAIAADLDAYPTASALIIYLGDIIDRGPSSKAVVQAVMDDCANPPDDVEVLCLRGNHDDWLAGFLDDPAILKLWAHKGGLETLASYGLAAEHVLAGVADIEIADDLRRKFLEVIPQRHKDFMLSLPLSHGDGDYFFAHAGIDPDRPLADQRREDLTWIRDKFLFSRKNFGKVVVHGHTPRDAVESLPNRINVDTGVYLRQVLSCVILDGAERHVLQVAGTAASGETGPG